MMSYKLIQPAVNIGIGIGTADLMANVIVYLQYRQIVVYVGTTLLLIAPATLYSIWFSPLISMPGSQESYDCSGTGN